MLNCLNLKDIVPKHLKLLEIDQSIKYFSLQNILDLGSSRVHAVRNILRRIQDRNLVAIDVLNMKPINGVKFIQGDINSNDVREENKKNNDWGRPCFI